MEEKLTYESAQKMLQQRQADRVQEIGQELDALKKRLRFEQVGVPRYVRDSNGFTTVVDVMNVLIDE